MSAIKEDLLQVACDNGASGFKFYTLYKGQENLMLLGPEAMRVPIALLESRKLGLEGSDPENRAWVRQSADDSNCTVVGRLAAQLQAQPTVRKAKEATLVPKLQSGLGAICERLGLLQQERKRGRRRKVRVELILLMPFDEYSRGEKIANSIEGSLQKFYFGNSLVEIKLEFVKVLPEGYGMISLGNLREKARSSMQVVWTFGFRNSGLIMYESGMPPRGATSDYGLRIVVDNLMNRYGISDRLGLARIIERVRVGKDKDDPELRALAANLCSTRKEQGAIQTEICQAIDLEMSGYWELLHQWFHEKVSGQVGGIAVCGGTAALLQSEISAYLQGIEIFWAENVFPGIEALLQEYQPGTPKAALEGNVRRFVDVVGAGMHFKRVMVS